MKKKIRVRDYEAEKEVWKKQDGMFAEVASRPFPYNVPNFIPFADISCYKTIEIETKGKVEFKK